MPDGAHASRAVDAEAHVPFAARVWLARVHAHPHANLRAVRPGVALKRDLRIDRACDRIARARKRDEERVALGVDLTAPVGLEALSKDR